MTSLLGSPSSPPTLPSQAAAASAAVGRGEEPSEPLSHLLSEGTFVCQSVGGNIGGIEGKIGGSVARAVSSQVCEWSGLPSEDNLGFDPDIDDREDSAPHDFPSAFPVVVGGSPHCLVPFMLFSLPSQLPTLPDFVLAIHPSRCGFGWDTSSDNYNMLSKNKYTQFSL